MKNKLKTTLIILAIIVSCLSVGVYAATAISATDVNYTKSNGSTVSVKAALDELRAGLPTKSIGDEVTVGGEQFYVLDWNNDSDTVNLIAKYVLNSDGTAQTSYDSYCEFSSKNYWSSSFTGSPFNLNDIEGFTSTDALGKAKSYGRRKGAVISRLLSYEEASAFKTKSNSNSKIRSMFAINQLYWLGSAYDSDHFIWIVYYNGIVQYNAYRNQTYCRGTPSYYSLKI